MKYRAETILGAILIVVARLVGLYGISMDISVESSAGGRTINTGLVATRSAVFMFSQTFLIVGADR